METVNVEFLGQSPQYQAYSSDDKRLITSTTIQGGFGQPDDYVEYHIYDLNNVLLTSNYNYTGYRVTADSNTATNNYSNIILDPEEDVKDNGYSRGSVIIGYNFYKQALETGPGRSFYIKQISPSRTEIKVTRLDRANSDIQRAFNTFSNQLTINSYQEDFYLNFGGGEEIRGINTVYIEEEGTGYVLIKLYEPLPRDYDLKSQFWVVIKNAESVRYQVTTTVEADKIIDQTALRGPNFNIQLTQKVGQTTPYYNYDTLFSTTVTSSYQQIQSLFDEKALRINVNYSNFSNFIHFSSATERIQNFTYKVRLIEQFNNNIAQLNNIVGGTSNATILSSSKVTLQNNINNIITKFDSYEYYLYYTSASTAWPKSTSTPPYTLFASTSSIVSSWLGNDYTAPSTEGLSILYSASIYDNLNSNSLRYTAPTYLREDTDNQPYVTFLDMIGQHFDNIWIYYRDVTNRFSAENNPDVGISIDLVGDALRGLGIELYTNTNVSDNIYYSLLGINPDGNLLPPTGSEVITNYVTSSIQTLPALTLEEEVYKRLYHNLPYLLKTKGTERGIRALIACYGIPNSILTVNEFGGYDMFTESDILGIQDNKIYTGSAEELGDPVLSPYTTIQVYNNNTERNSEDIEIGFSPADSINADITASLPNISIRQLISNPALQYSSSYTPLDIVNTNYFASNYNRRYNVWDFIRIIKYYNNSLFKTLKDFVPARASLASSIIIKPHMLERNRYARHEPLIDTSSIGSDQAGIQMVTISGSDPDVIKYSTDHTSIAITSIGLIPISNIYSFEKYTGEFSGTVVKPVNNYFPQVEYSYQPYLTSSRVREIQLIATYNNVTASVKSTRFFDLDYSSNQSVPVNYGLITQSINDGQGALLNPYAPYAQLQDYNYHIRRSIIPRYIGSHLSGKYYNVYSAGDISYGSNPVINWNASKLGLFTQIYTSSFLPGLVNIALAYSADVSGGLGELNQENRNWVEIQNTYRAGTNLTIKQFDSRKYSAQQTTDGIKRIFSSGYAYTPLIYFGNCAADTTASFENLEGNNSQYALVAQNSLDPNQYITGSTSPRYALHQTSSTFLSTGNINYPVSLVGNLYDNVLQVTDAYITGTATTPPSYSVDIPGNYNISSNIVIAIEAQTTPAREMKWVLQVVKFKPSTGQHTILRENSRVITMGANTAATIEILNYNSVASSNGTFVNYFNVRVPATTAAFQMDLSYVKVDGYREPNNQCTTLLGSDIGCVNPTIGGSGQWTCGNPIVTVKAGAARIFSVYGKFPATLVSTNPNNPLNATKSYKLNPQIRIQPPGQAFALINQSSTFIVGGTAITNITSPACQAFTLDLGNINPGPFTGGSSNLIPNPLPLNNQV